VSKATARKAFVDGFSIAFCPSNLRPGATLHPEYITSREMRSDYIADDIGAANDFENLLNSFMYYNCTTNKTGKYTMFFIETGDNYIHLSFENGSNPYLFYGNAPECMKELARWKKHYSIEFSKAHFYTAKEKKAKE
jgi:hypothetical protein